MTSAKPWPQLGNLPADVTSFVGRRRELSPARRLLGAARLLTLVGAGWRPAPIWTGPGSPPAPRRWTGRRGQSWIHRNLRTKAGRAYFHLACEAVWAAEASDVSRLHALFYTHSNASGSGWAEKFTRGCYGTHFASGVWTSYSEAWRAPAGRIHWAGAECSPHWNGYMEGAVRRGEATAPIVAAP
jgi:hypothetical protein